MGNELNGQRINDILKSFTVFHCLLISTCVNFFVCSLKLVKFHRKTNSFRCAEPPKMCFCSLWVFLSQISAAFVMVHVLASPLTLRLIESVSRRVQKDMEKAVIYFNYFTFQTSSNISFEAIHPRIWHWLKKHSNEALVFFKTLTFPWRFSWTSNCCGLKPKKLLTFRKTTQKSFSSAT